MWKSNAWIQSKLLFKHTKTGCILYSDDCLIYRKRIQISRLQTKAKKPFDIGRIQKMQTMYKMYFLFPSACLPGCAITPPARPIKAPIVFERNMNVNPTTLTLPFDFGSRDVVPAEKTDVLHQQK